MSKKLILASHCGLATGMRSALSMICGELNEVYTVELLPQEDGAAFLEKLNQVFKHFDQTDEVFVFVDLMGGSPCNTVILKAMEHEHVHVISGMNLAAVLTAYLQDVDVLQVLEAGIHNLMDVKDYLKNQKMRDEE